MNVSREGSASRGNYAAGDAKKLSLIPLFRAPTSIQTLSIGGEPPSTHRVRLQQFAPSPRPCNICTSKHHFVSAK